jgi:hypothetical protein
VPQEVLDALASFGLSSICNVVAAIKTADKLGLGPDDAMITVATDGDMMYSTEHTKTLAADFPGGFDRKTAEAVLDRWLYGASGDHVLELTECDRRRIFNLGYFTWVEQQDVPIEEFRVRKDQKFWTDMRTIVTDWDRLIDEFNARTGVLAAL